MLRDNQQTNNLPNSQELELELLTLTKNLANELQIPSTRLETLNLDTAFDKELGLDSLSRVEFISRIEKYFGIRLPETVVVEAETPRQLLNEILTSDKSPQFKQITGVRSEQRSKTDQNPIEAKTLVDVLRWHLSKHPERLYITLYHDDPDQQENICYGELWQGAEKIAIGLQQQGLFAKQAIAIMLPTGKDYLFSFFGILMAGGIPTPIYPPVRLSQLEDHLIRHTSILSNCQAPIIITIPEAKQVARLLKARVSTMRTIVTAAELSAAGARLLPPKIKPDDIAFLQYTSGSTGTPKGVMLSHANLLANIRLMGGRVKIDSTDIFISWLPLYHDMGLIGALLGTQYFSTLLVLMSPLMFLAKPSRWLWAIHRNQGTMTAAPNFAYELCLKRIADQEIEGIDLSSIKAMFNGAEAVKPTTLRQFNQRFGDYGLSPKALKPVYGLAECSLGLSFPSADREPIIDSIDRELFTQSGYAKVTSNNDSPLQFVSCGEPLREHQIRIVDGSGHELPERRQGHLQFKGPSVTDGYYRNPEKTNELLMGDWVNSGDLAYIAEGEVYLTGRIKDIIIHAGRNIYPHELEESVGEIPGVRKGCVAVFGSNVGDAVTERLIVLAETRETDNDVKEAMRAKINEVAVNTINSAPEDVVLAPPNSVLKTSSGKIRRSACRELYESGLVGKGPKPLWKQIASLVVSSIIPQFYRFRSQVFAGLFAAYAWLIFLPTATLTWLAVCICPKESWRWKIMPAIGRFVSFAVNIPIIVSEHKQLPSLTSPAIYVSNHSSYTDSLILMSIITRKIRFVAKSELKNQIVAGTFLRKIGTYFVDRFDKRKGIEAAKKVIEYAKAGESLLFFPEGTFTRMPGLLPFHMGAFVTAAETGLPIVPISIRGSRSWLRPGSFFPHHHAPIYVTICDEIDPNSLKVVGKETWDIALELREKARKSILAHNGEPDLGSEKSPI